MGRSVEVIPVVSSEIMPVIWMDEYCPSLTQKICSTHSGCMKRMPSKYPIHPTLEPSPVSTQGVMLGVGAVPDSLILRNK